MALILIGCIYIGLLLLVIAGMWKTFTKARQPGWACLIPIYNIYVLTQIAGKSGWFVLLYFVPLVNIVVAVMVTHSISVKFGHGVGFTLGILFLPMIFYPILGFGDSQYQG